MYSAGPVSRTARQIVEDLGRLHPLILLYLLAVILPVGFDIGSVAFTGLRVVLLLLFVPLAFKVYVSKVDRIYPIDVLFALHVLWMFVAIGVNNPNRVVQNASSVGLEFLGGYLLGRAYIRSAGDMFALVRALIALAVLSLVFAIPESLNSKAIIPDWISRIPGLTTVSQTDIPMRMGLHRAQVYFAHPIHYGLFCSSAFALTLVGLRNVMTKGKRILFASLIGLGVFLSLSSGALLSVVLQLGLILWSHVFRRNPSRWKLLLGLFAALYIFIDVASNRTPLKVFMSYATFSAHNAYYRSIIFDWGMMNVNSNPIFGLGLRDWIRPHYMGSGSVDNFWLMMAMRYGYPGFALIAAGYVSALISVGRRKLSPGTSQADLRLAWMMMFVGLSFTLATVHVWTSVYSFVFFLMGAGMWLAGANDDATGTAPPAVAVGDQGPRWTRTHSLQDSGLHRWSRKDDGRNDPVLTRSCTSETSPTAFDESANVQSPPEKVEKATRDGPMLTRFSNSHRRH